MWPLKAPAISALESYRACYGEAAKKEIPTFAAAEEAIESAANSFDKAAADAALYKLDETTFSTAGSVTAAGLTNLYEGKMARKRRPVDDSPAREIYHKILSGARHRLCPLCSANRATTLDHHLPKSQFQSLSVHPANLIPACRDCNTTKLVAVPTTADTQTLHPYFENGNDKIWLKARVKRGDPATVEYYSDPPSSWGELKCRRVTHHFNTFHLGDTYLTHGSVLMENIEAGVFDLFFQAGWESVQEFLIEQVATHRSAQLNSWQAATFSALAQSRWYYRDRFESGTTKL